MVETNTNMPAMLCGQRHQIVDFGHADGTGLFDKYMLTGFDSLTGNRRERGIDRCNHNNINIGRGYCLRD